MIKEISVFPNYIYRGHLEKINCESIYDESILLEKNNNGRIISNRIGWQSDNLANKDLNSHQSIKNLANKTLEVVSELYYVWGINSFGANLSEFWININRTNAFNLQHTHPGCVLSAVYYAKCNKDSGSIVFERPDNMELFFLPEKTTSYTEVVHEILPEPGELIIFPSFFRHYVNPNMSNQDRVSVAFNFI